MALTPSNHYAKINTVRDFVRLFRTWLANDLTLTANKTLIKAATGLSKKAVLTCPVAIATADLVLTEVFNDSGITFTGLRQGTGIYRLTASAACFTAGKTIIKPQFDTAAAGAKVDVTYINTTTADIKIYKEGAAVFAVSDLNAAGTNSGLIIEVEVYS